LIILSSLFDVMLILEFVIPRLGSFCAVMLSPWLSAAFRRPGLSKKRPGACEALTERSGLLQYF
jgi:hypothetical protein